MRRRTSDFRWQDDHCFAIVDRWSLAEELWAFGEDELVARLLELPSAEMVRVWTFGGRILLRGEARSVRQAAALGAVAAIEGGGRPLARSRRRPRSRGPQFEVSNEERLADVHRIEDEQQFPHGR